MLYEVITTIGMFYHQGIAVEAHGGYAVGELYFAVGCGDEIIGFFGTGFITITQAKASVITSYSIHYTKLYEHQGGYFT